MNRVYLSSISLFLILALASCGGDPKTTLKFVVDPKASVNPMLELGLISEAKIQIQSADGQSIFEHSFLSSLQSGEAKVVEVALEDLPNYVPGRNYKMVSIVELAARSAGQGGIRIKAGGKDFSNGTEFRNYAWTETVKDNIVSQPGSNNVWSLHLSIQSLSFTSAGLHLEPAFVVSSSFSSRVMN